MSASVPIRLLIWIYCLSWAFDYRATEDGGSIFQYVCFGITFASAAGVVLLGWRKLFVLPTGKLLLGWELYLAGTVIVMLINDVEFGWYGRNILPPVLVLTSIAVVQVAAGCGFGYNTVLIPMVIASVINVIWKALYSLVIAGVPMDEIRLEMLSQCLPFLMGYMMTGLLLRPTLPRLSLLAGSLGVLSFMVSITRTSIFVIGAAGVGALIGLWRAKKLGLLPLDFWKAKLRHVLSAGVLAIFILGMVGIVAPIVYERWAERLFHSTGSEYMSIDPSALTRLAETKSFYDLLNEEPSTWIFGRGVGYPYYWDESFIPELMYTYDDPDAFRSQTIDVRFPGHSIWTYAAFSGGILGLLWYLWLFFASIRQSWKCTKLLPGLPKFPLEIAFMPLAGLLAYVGESLTTNPFIERTGGLVLGVMVAFPQFIYAAHYRKNMKAQGVPVQIQNEPVLLMPESVSPHAPPHPSA